MLADRATVCALFDRLFAERAPGTICGTVYTLRVFARYARERGWVTSFEIQDDDAPRRMPVRPIVLYSPDEIALLLRTVRSRRGDLRYWMFLATMVETGRRAGEILGLRFEDVIFDGPLPHFLLSSTKTGRCQYVPLTRMLREEVWTSQHIERIKFEGDPRLQNRMKDMPFPWHYNSVRCRLERLCRDTGIRYRGYHTFRHTKATAMLGRGVPVPAVSALLGHACVSTTERTYNHSHALNFVAYVDA